MTYCLSDSNDKNTAPHFPKCGHSTSCRNREITSPQSLHYLSLSISLLFLLSSSSLTAVSVSPTHFQSLSQTFSHIFTQRFSRIVIFAPHASLQNQTKPIFPPSHGFDFSSKYTALSSIYLNDRMASSRCFDSPSAALRLVVGPVVLSGLNLYPELILLSAAGKRPFQRRQVSHWHTKR